MDFPLRACFRDQDDRSCLEKSSWKNAESLKRMRFPAALNDLYCSLLLQNRYLVKYFYTFFGKNQIPNQRMPRWFGSQKSHYECEKGRKITIKRSHKGTASNFFYPRWPIWQNESFYNPWWGGRTMLFEMEKCGGCRTCEIVFYSGSDLGNWWKLQKNESKNGWLWGLRAAFLDPKSSF